MTKQQALDRLNLMRVWYEDYGTPDADYDAICYAIGVIEEMPEGTDTLIKALEQEHKKLREMQKAQPEIIQCNDCIYKRICKWKRHGATYCSLAERRTDG